MNSKTLKSLRKFACLNQKQTIKYNYLISEEHKELKDFFINWKKDNSNNLDVLAERYNSFILNSFNTLLSILESNKEPIFEMFRSLNNDTIPRITIKVIQEDNVINLFSSTKGMDIFSASKITENTGFDEILNKNKLIFLENNLPDRFKNNQYKNPRLKKSAYKEFIGNKIKWKDCWEGTNKIEDVEYYSSTLIVPMSIRNDENDVEYEDYFHHFFKNVKQYKDSRTIWGFLCFDSINTDYFDSKKNPDLYSDLAYIIADQLSLYLIFFYNYTSGSKTILEIKDIVYN